MNEQKRTLLNLNKLMTNSLTENEFGNLQKIKKNTTGIDYNVWLTYINKVLQRIKRQDIKSTNNKKLYSYLETKKRYIERQKDRAKAFINSTPKLPNNIHYAVLRNNVRLQNNANKLVKNLVTKYTPGATPSQTVELTNWLVKHNNINLLKEHFTMSALSHNVFVKHVKNMKDLQMLHNLTIASRKKFRSRIKNEQYNKFMSLTKKDKNKVMDMIQFLFRPYVSPANARKERREYIKLFIIIQTLDSKRKMLKKIIRTEDHPRELYPLLRDINSFSEKVIDQKLYTLILKHWGRPVVRNIIIYGRY